MSDLFVAPFSAGYMQRAGIQLVLLGVLSGFLGVHVLLRKAAFVTEVVQHTVFPGLAIAFAFGQSLLAGALCSGLVSIFALSFVSGGKGERRIAMDSVMAVLLTTFFAGGVLVVSRQGGYQSDLSSLLFGRILAVDTNQIRDTLVIATLCLVAMAGLHKELVLRAFDPLAAAALGYRLRSLDLVLNVMITLTVVAAVRAVGTVLVVAFLVTPAATARLLVRSVPRMMVCSAVFAVVGGLGGLLLSYHGSVTYGWRLASGATVVFLFTLMFLVVWIVVTIKAARQSLLAHARDVGLGASLQERSMANGASRLRP